MTSTTLTPDSCGAVVYVDDANEAVKFAIFFRGKWATEQIVDLDGESVVDVGLDIDSSGNPHIVILSESPGYGWNATYYTKVNGVWGSQLVYSALVASSKSLSASSIETSGNGSIYLIVQELTVDGGTTYTLSLIHI